MELLILQEALQRVAAATLDGANIGTELGGSLLALEPTTHQRVIVHAVPTGDNAERSSVRLLTDHDYQNLAITHARSVLPSVAYVGDWHCHPPEHDRLSGTDLQTAAQILMDHPERADLILLLGVPKRDGVIVRAFHVTHHSDDQSPYADHTPRLPEIAVQELEYQLVERDDRRLLALLGATPPDLDLPLEPEPLPGVLSSEPPAHVTDECATGRALAPSPPGADPRATTPLHHAEADRITHELTLLRARGASTTLRDAEGDPAATIRWNDTTFHAIFPPEFPSGAPILFRGELDSTDFQQLPLRYGWSSLHHLVDALQEQAPSRSPRGRIARYLRNNPGAIDHLRRYILGFDLGALTISLIWIFSR